MPDTRTLPSLFKQDIRRPHGAGAVRLWFLSLLDADLGVSETYFTEGEDAALVTGSLSTLPIRIVCEDGGYASTAAGAPINYKLLETVSDGVFSSTSQNLYTSLPFTVEVLTDADEPPRARIVLPNIDPAIGNFARALKKSPRILLKLHLLADFNATPDGDNARVSIGEPTGFVIDWMRITRVRGNPVQIEAELGSYDLTPEPYPNLRATPGETPGLSWQ